MRVIGVKAVRVNNLEIGIGFGENSRMDQVFVCSLRDCVSLDWYTFPEDHRSPHDSWVEAITISEPSDGDRHEKRGLQIHIRLLGAYHDGTIEFTYKSVPPKQGPKY
jgi:hypothetical protein